MINNTRLLRLSLAAVWLLTAAASMAYPQTQSIAMLERVGLHGEITLTALSAGITLDAAMGILTLINLRAMQKWLWLTQAALIVTYSFIIAVYLPDYALHPFGMLIKNIPLLVILWLLWREASMKQGDQHV